MQGHRAPRSLPAASCPWGVRESLQLCDLGKTPLSGWFAFVNRNDENCFQGVRKRKGLEQEIKDTGAWRVYASSSQTVVLELSGGPQDPFTGNSQGQNYLHKNIKMSFARVTHFHECNWSFPETTWQVVLSTDGMQRQAGESS